VSTLREELTGAVRPTLYSILLPPGWRKVAPAELASEDAAAPSLAAMRAAGRPELILQVRGMLSRFRAALRDSRAFDAYLPPAVDGVMLPAGLLVAPFVLPSGVDWDAAASRMAKGAEVERPEGTETSMLVWRRAEKVADDAATLVGRTSHYLVPVDEPDTRRALHFQYTVLVADSAQIADAVDTLEGLGDLMMATMRWRPTPA
jgi:hypothetical protein